MNGFCQTCQEHHVKKVPSINSGDIEKDKTKFPHHMQKSTRNGSKIHILKLNYETPIGENIDELQC